MSPTTFKTLKTSTQIASVILSVFINSLLITLIITKSAKKMGNYRHLMIYFCCCSIMFSLMDIFIRPVIHTYESAFFMVMDLRGRDMSLDLAGGMICKFFGLCWARIKTWIKVQWLDFLIKVFQNLSWRFSKLGNLGEVCAFWKD